MKMMKAGDVRGSQVSRRWAAGLLGLGLVGLSGCQDTEKGSYHYFTEPELIPFYTALPLTPLPALISTPLGEDYKLSGTVQDWKSNKAVLLYHSPYGPTPPATADGQISEMGQFMSTTPLLNLASPAAPLRDYLGLMGGYCPLDTLTASSSVRLRALAPRLDYYIRDLSGALTLRPQTSPPVFTLPVIPEQDGLTLLWAPESLTVQGEVRCLNGGEGTQTPKDPQVFQSNTVVNLKLERGWNAVARNITSLGTTEKSVKRTQITWAASPAAELTKWKTY